MSDRMLLGSTLGNTSNSIARGPVVPAVHEELVVDARASLRPAEMVDAKLRSMLRAVPMPVSLFGGAFRKR